ncbi:Atp-dependent dna helicase [Thalictrum thalictroides]|uniref:ATP-dependent DNA helicase n=1 Tax=Thalictrum thalictroides TaxID=46969 RepID=A0A7J6WCI5_THATH|nr:Atp-dependent dna helicase [Thalictrum thalictroides]
MEGNDVSTDHVVAGLIEMGFESSQVMEAIESVGPSIDSAVEFILNASQRKSSGAFSGSNCSTSNAHTLGKRSVSSSRPLGRMKQSSIVKHLESTTTPKRIKTQDTSHATVSCSKKGSEPLEEQKASLCYGNSLRHMMSSSALPVCNQQVQEIGSDWENKVKNLLQVHFGISSLKSFQKEALEAWFANQDCLVLAATGSGKSLCFQIPALLTGKVVVVISPLISLMHDQCLKLAKHGVSACFLGSGQTDNTVEQKAMNGAYGVVYVCPETVLRLIKPLQRLAEIRGIALFAIDEVHCVSKWGHDFRPDYRKLSLLRETFRASNLKFLKSDVPIMALTATATIRVRKDILESLCMSEETKIVLTSFFRPNLRFQVNDSRTSMKSYEKDFLELIEAYSPKRRTGKKEHSTILHGSEDESDYSHTSDEDEVFQSDLKVIEDDRYSGTDTKGSSINLNSKFALEDNKLSVEYLEDELDVVQSVDDIDVACGEFCGYSSTENVETFIPSETIEMQMKPEERCRLLQGPLEHGPTIIYVPTRKETLTLAKYLCMFGVKAAAYNAKLPKMHLRQVHKEFHQNDLQVIVATIAFGMGIDKSNVRRIIHYGWPQSLEAYYQEAGRAGRDGKLADCVLFANLSRIPTLLPSHRTQEQTKQANKMLSDCFRYGMGTAICRAKTLVEYFGENFDYENCLLCDVCVNGPPELQDLKEEAEIFMRVLTSYYAQTSYGDDNAMPRGRHTEKPNFRMLTSGIRQQFPKFATRDHIWWQGLARLLEDKGYIREGNDKKHVSIKFPEPTDLGLSFLHSGMKSFLAYPEADMLLSLRNPKSNSSFSDWGKGWADPEIRRQRLHGRKSRRTIRKRKSRRRPDQKTVRGRILDGWSRQRYSLKALSPDFSRLVELVEFHTGPELAMNTLLQV